MPRQVILAMKACTDIRLVSSATAVVDDAVGMGHPRWYAAIVNHNSEKNTADKLSALGYDCYVASQSEVRIWRNGKRKQIERIVIPSIVFIRCTEKERLNIVREPYIYRFLTNKASSGGQHGSPVAVIPDVQISRLRFMLGHSDHPVEFVNRVYGRGDRVRVVRGSLRGLEGEVLTVEEGRNELLVYIEMLGCAKVTIDPLDLEPAE